MGSISLPAVWPGRAAILATVLALFTAAWSPAVARADETQEAPRPSLLLVTVASLRSDRVQAIGQRGSRTPFLLSLGQRGALLHLARTPVPETIPALASLFTGLDPYLHGQYEGSEPATHVMTMGQRLAEDGYSGRAWFNAPLEQGMPFLARGLSETHEYPDLDATHLVDRVLATETGFLAAGGHFVWVHLDDASAPYTPDLADLLTYRQDGWNEIWNFPLALDEGNSLPDTLPRAAANGPMREAGFYMDSYDATVLKVDRALEALVGGLLPALEASRGYLVVASLHGESLGEHRSWFSHGSTLHEEELQVPILFMGPDVQPLPKPMETSWTSLIDVMPSIMNLMGLPHRQQRLPTSVEESSGFDLAPLLRGSSAPPVRRIPSGQAQAPYARTVLVEGRYKVIVTPPRPPMYQGTGIWPDVEQIQFYDLQNDPLEFTNQSVSRGDISNKMARHVRLNYPPWPNSPPARDTSRRR
jgi:arylsulfatase A-like enzyme